VDEGAMTARPRAPWLWLVGPVLLSGVFAVGHPARLAATAAPLPALTQPVHDFAGAVDADSEAQLDRYIRTLQAATGDAIVVVTIRTFRPDYGDIRAYAVELFENGGRGIGDKDKDNGLLVLLAVEDRKLWIEVGYGLEGAITDGFAGETARLYMAPLFKQGQYGAGLLAGVSRLIARIADQRDVTVADLPRLAPERRTEPRQRGIPLGFVGSVFLLLLILYLMNPRNRMGPPRGPGSLRGGRGGGVYWGAPMSGRSSWSGWSGGGSFGGGSFGGGFGGFGGGGSGGGGGGTSW
jgi:uncharacterized protein